MHTRRARRALSRAHTTRSPCSPEADWLDTIVRDDNGGVSAVVCHAVGTVLLALFVLEVGAARDARRRERDTVSRVGSDALRHHRHRGGLGARALESATRFGAFGARLFASDPWNVFDALVTVAALAAKVRARDLAAERSVVRGADRARSRRGA